MEIATSIIFIIFLVFLVVVLIFGTIIIWMVCKGMDNREDPTILEKWKNKHKENK